METPVKPATVLPPGTGHVLLQVELASKREARILQWTAWLLLLALVIITIIIVAAYGNRNTPRSLTYYRVALGVASASVFVAVVMAALFFYRVQLTRRQHKHWCGVLQRLRCGLRGSALAAGERKKRRSGEEQEKQEKLTVACPRPAGISGASRWR